MKRIRLTIEWAGACSEPAWGSVLSEAIEKFDASGLTRVSNVELVTSFGDTTPLTLAPDDSDPFLTPHEVRKYGRLWRHR
jgi:hypothetical protein